ncbi:MAG: hypothetical protein Q4C85_09435 [Actinomyces sp.]|uniref:hypothetical protein n=1 Tax=Actinomyces sp. TaxID=29317 RepID=UPI0026DAC2D7|nr:hypothetical protein [Actinomyces sp.]MDO4243960.1 hypothetical protein [Actinomyces sp.]
MLRCSSSSLCPGVGDGEALAEDVRKVRTHPLIPDTVQVGGFVYDVDTGLLDQRL